MNIQSVLHSGTPTTTNRRCDMSDVSSYPLQQDVSAPSGAAGLAPSEDQPAGSSSLESMKDLLAGGL